MKIGIVILNYKNFTDTINCLSSVIELITESEIFVVVVDNCSKNESVEEISDFLSKNKRKFLCIEEDYNFESNYRIENFTIIKSSKNTGYARGNNIGLKFLLKFKINYIAIINNDVLLKNTNFELLVSYLLKNKDIAFLSPLVLNKYGNIENNCCRNRPELKILFFEYLYYFFRFDLLNKKIHSQYVNLNIVINQENPVVRCDLVQGSFLFGSFDMWSVINGFDEKTFLYFEEHILYEKIRMLGKSMAIVTNTSCIHLGGKSTQNSYSYFLEKERRRSMLYYLKKYRNVNKICYIIISIISQIKIMMKIILNNKIL